MEHALERAAAIAANDPDFEQQYEADYLLGRALAMLGEFQQARAAYCRAIDAPTAAGTETAAMAQWMIGESYLHQDRYEDAAREYLRTESLHEWPEWQAAGLVQAAKCYELLERPRPASETRARLLAKYGETTWAAEAQRPRLARQPPAAEHIATKPSS